MRTLFTLIILCILWLNVMAQTPQKMSYQAVVRNAGGNLVTNKQVGMRITILEGTLPGTNVYQEIQTPTTNANGLLTIEIGGGAGFDAINWGSGIHFIKTETDPAGGTNYTLSGTSQLLSVPYALYAKTAGNGSLWSQSGSNIFYNNGKVGIGVSEPTFNLDIRGNYTDNGGVVVLGNSDLSHKMVLFGGRENDPNPFINWKHGDPLRFTTDEYGWSEKMRISSEGFVGIGTITPTSPLHVAGKAVIETSYFGDGIELNWFGKGNRYAGIDFHGDDTYTDYGLRIIRWNTGPDAPSSIEHKGLGELRLFTEQAAPIKFSTSSILRMTISPTGEINVNSNNIKSVADPVDAQDAATKAYVDAQKGHYVGEIYGGGVVFYVDNSRQHGLIIEYDFLWAIWSNVVTQIGAAAQSPWDGFSNSLAIYNQSGMTSSAAKTCFLHQSWTGMDDWFLPSIGQLNLLYNVSYELNYSLSNNINFTELEGLVWSSTEDSAQGYAKAIDLSTGTAYSYQKSTSLRVRPIRKF